MIRQLASIASRALRTFPRRVIAAPSKIAGMGLFAARRFEAGRTIGQLALGRPGPQGQHTLQVGHTHRVVKKPWRYLNHACEPTARLIISDREATLIATRPLPPRAEITIDYNALPERISQPFRCRCEHCQSANRAATVGPET